ncbi:MAG: hypothetical protein AAGA99_24280 [Actinomycetota bacterium]
MFLHQCPTCGERRLRSIHAIQDVINTPDGPLAVVRCGRGHDAAVDFRRPHEPVAMAL